jgi:cytochrome c oxidase cbb3-type subunit 3
MRPRSSLAAGALLLLICIAARLAAQGQPQVPPGTPAQGQGQGQGQGGRGGRGQPTFPAQQRPPGDPAQIERGKNLYGVTCRACHGADLRGGDMGGPNLLRSQLVLNDQDAELILPVVQNGRQNPGMPVMPPMNIPPDDVKALAAFIHSVAAASRGQGAPPPGEAVMLNIVVGDAAAGKAYFDSKCAACHAATGDLAGVATRISDPMQLQNTWVSGGGGGGRGRDGGGGPAAGTEGGAPARRSREVTVTVTHPSGETVSGRLVRIDDFIVTLAQADGTQRSFRRDGDVPKVEINDPLEAHRKLLTVYTDKDIHDVTAYLVTVK